MTRHDKKYPKNKRFQIMTGEKEDKELRSFSNIVKNRTGINISLSHIYRNGAKLFKRLFELKLNDNQEEICPLDELNKLLEENKRMKKDIEDLIYTLSCLNHELKKLKDKYE